MSLKWLLVGPGDIANTRVAPALKAAEGSELVAVCGRAGSAKTRALAEKYAIPLVYDDLDRALAESGADAVYICTPHTLHVGQCLRTIETGKHVFSEKPLGETTAECLPLLQAVDAHPDLAAACSDYRLFTNQFRTTRRLVRDGAIGELSGGWAHDEEAFFNPGGGPKLKSRGASRLLSLGFYLFDIARALFGMPEEVFAAMTSFNFQKEMDYDVEDMIDVLLKFPGGKRFSVRIETTFQGPLRHAYEFCGSDGRILWPECPPHFNSPIVLVDKQGSRVLEGSHSGPECGVRPNWHLPMIQDFVDAVAAHRPPFCSIANAVDVMRIADAALASAEADAPVRLGERQA